MRDKKKRRIQKLCKSACNNRNAVYIIDNMPRKAVSGQKKTHQRAFDLAINDLNKFLFELAVQFYRGLKLKRATSLLKVNAV